MTKLSPPRLVLYGLLLVLATATVVTLLVRWSVKSAMEVQRQEQDKARVAKEAEDEARREEVRRLEEKRAQDAEKQRRLEEEERMAREERERARQAEERSRREAEERERREAEERTRAERIREARKGLTLGDTVYFYSKNEVTGRLFRNGTSHFVYTGSVQGFNQENTSTFVKVVVIERYWTPSLLSSKRRNPTCMPYADEANISFASPYGDFCTGDSIWVPLREAETSLSRVLALIDD